LAFTAGCGPNYKARATVKGKVTFANTNLTVGSVTFNGKDNVTGTASIDKNGNYVMNDAPLGDVTITVSVPSQPTGGLARGGPSPFKPPKDGGSVNPENPEQRISIMGEMPARVVPIPEKYANVQTSGLTYTVEKGEHTHDINLTP
jgi:hypothetical protein